ncbi:C10 family peptidase [Enterococcus faecium]|uniref:C10 family peptidase n=1 Tax=Enterococcus faecium TaxID=1352 RepID=UPI0035D81BC5
MNKKNLYISILSILLGASIFFSSTVGADEGKFDRNEFEAKDSAITFIEKTTGIEKMNDVEKTTGHDIQQDDLTEVSLNNDISNMYIYNISSGGFVIVSSDKRSPEILGYSKKGTFDFEGKENIYSFIKNYDSQIKENKSLNTECNLSDVKEQPIVESLLDAKTIQYDQNFPYNLKTPIIEKIKFGEKSYIGKNAATGCVATAVAQIMKYHNYPKKGSKDHISILSNMYFNPRILTAKISIRQYDWNNILPFYSGNETDLQKNSIAELMSDIGISVDMSYGPSSGTSGSPVVQRALKENFGYSCFVQEIDRDDFCKENWEEKINNELTHIRPVYYQGIGDEGGHAFVLDGSDGNGFYHINWGWGGDSNGFFRLDALNPSILGTGGGSGGFNDHQSAVVGIAP